MARPERRSASVNAIRRAGSVGAALSAMRKQAGLSRDETAERANVASGTYSRYEKDVTARPDSGALRRIVVTLARELGADPESAWTAIGKVLDRTERADYLLRAEVSAIKHRHRAR